MGQSKFPRRKTEIIALAQSMINGFTENQADFSTLPVNIINLQSKLDTALSKRNIRVTAEAALAEAVGDENEAYDDLGDDMKINLHYAESVARNNDAKLKGIGWSARAAPTPMQSPGIPRLFEITKQGRGWASFEWKSPADGGKVTMYRLMRMEVGKNEVVWTEVASAIDCKVQVTGQDNGKEYAFCVVAVNSAGESFQSNTAMAFL